MAEARIDGDPGFAAAYRQAMNRYERERDALVEAESAHHRPSGGVGGTRRGVKCLHAHYADHAAGNANPIGFDTATTVEPLDCSVPCVTSTGGLVTRNPDWVEPTR
jgi:hypothetical protein